MELRIGQVRIRLVTDGGARRMAARPYAEMAKELAAALRRGLTAINVAVERPHYPEACEVLQAAVDAARDSRRQSTIRIIPADERTADVYAEVLAALTRAETFREQLRCPVCGALHDAAPVAEAARRLRAAGRGYWWGEPDKLADAIRQGNCGWACPDCLQEGRALPADPLAQTFCDDPPYLAYHDVTRACQDCGQTFTFPATEQQYWYEELKFWVQSRPNQCRVCRRRRREWKARQQELAAAINRLDPQDPVQLARVAELLLQLENRQKGLEYLRRACNVARRSGADAALLIRLQELEAGPSS